MKLTWQCVVQYSIAIIIVVGVLYLICREPPSQMSLILGKEENYVDTGDMNNVDCATSYYFPTMCPDGDVGGDATDCRQMDITCRMEYGDDSDAYCQCMKSLGCERDWCHCLTVVNKCAKESKSREEFCRCIKRSDCADQVPCDQDTTKDCGFITTRCQELYPYNVRACVLYHGCKPFSDPICVNCRQQFAADVFSMSACQLCRGCQANEDVYADAQAEGKLPKCNEIPPYVSPPPKISAAEQRELDYLRIERRCGLTDVFKFPGDYFKDPDEKYCYCCVGRAKNGGKFDNCNCNNAEDCLNTDKTMERCKGFMQKYGISAEDMPRDVNVTLSDSMSKAVKQG